MVTVQFTPDQVAKTFEAAERTLGLLNALALLTPTKYDDEAVKAAQAFFDALKPYVREEWFASLLTLLQGLFERKGVKAVVEHLQSL